MISAAQILNADVRALARAATAVENREPNAKALLKELFAHTGQAAIIGITGAPGAGKSTLVDRLARAYRTDNKRVAIVAVDPSSPYTGGAILGDRIRMQAHYADPGVFIRSMATRGCLGGLARTTADVAVLLDAAGFGAVLIETVGVGQDEVEIARLADVTLVVLVPNMGNDVQAIKAGIMEIADIFVINKSDQPGADRLEREIRAVQSLSTRSDGWVPPVIWTVASQDSGTTDLLDAVRRFRDHGPKDTKAVQTWSLRLRDMLREELLEKINQIDVQAAAERVAGREADPYTIVDEWVRNLIHG